VPRARRTPVSRKSSAGNGPWRIDDVNRVVSGIGDVQTVVGVGRVIESAFSDMRRKFDISEMFDDHLFADLVYITL
jgi:hypothetical protein